MSIEELIAPLIARDLVDNEPAVNIDYSKFWLHVDRSDDPSDHWIWTGTKHGEGYGMWHRGGKPDMAHRVAWELIYGERPQGWLKPKCGRKDCVNPLHRRLIRPGGAFR